MPLVGIFLSGPTIRRKGQKEIKHTKEAGKPFCAEAATTRTSSDSVRLFQCDTKSTMGLCVHCHNILIDDPNNYGSRKEMSLFTKTVSFFLDPCAPRAAGEAESALAARRRPPGVPAPLKPGANARRKSPALSGRVVETMNAGGYTCVRLEKGGKRRGLPVPVMKVSSRAEGGFAARPRPWKTLRARP